MGEPQNANNLNRDWKKRESFTSALVQIAVVALVLAGAVFFIYQRGSKRKAVAEHLKEARSLALRGNAQDLEKALAELDELFKVDAASGDGHALAADLHTQLWLVHRVPGAEQKAKEALQKAEAGDSKSDERYGTRALHMIVEGKAREADAFVEDLRKKGASTARLWFAQARAQQELGNLALAKTGFAQAVDKAWKDPRFSTAFGEALLEEGQFLQAMDVLSKAVASTPDNVHARITRAMVQVLKQDRVKDAADTVAELLGQEASLTPGMKARVLAVKAELANFEGKHDEALKVADEALAVNGDDAFALFAKARALGLKKDPDAADAFKAVVAKRTVAPLFYFDGATLLQAAGNTDAAMALLSTYETAFKGVTTTTTDGKQLPALDRDDRYWLTRGDVLRGAGKLDEAMAAYDKAIAAENVNLVKAHYAKGSIYLAKKEYDKAIEALKDITPPDGSGTLAEAYMAMGDTLFAKKEYAPGCQNYAFALAKFKMQQAPREKLNGILEDVNKRLIAAGQKPMAKAWMEEAKPIIQ